MIFLVCCVTLFLPAALSQPPLRQQYPWFHTNNEIHSQLVAITDGCGAAQATLATSLVSNGSDQVDFDVVYIKRGSSEGKKKAFLVFGEHARELVTTETALHFLNTLCGGGSNESLAGRVLESTDFVVVPNANPFGRKRVEAGEYCKRTNENNVDINRNWEDGHASEEETNPGPHAFSEPETQSIRDLVAEEKPDVFLSVHSGAYLLGAPLGADSSVLGPISQEFCGGECPYGNLNDVIGYTSHGCDIDYVKEHFDTKYAFTWEIYTDSSLRQYYAEKAHARAEGRAMRSDAETFFSMNSLMFLQDSHHLQGPNISNTTYVESQDDMDCFKQFNPQTEQETQEVAENWAKAFMTLCDSLQSNALNGKMSTMPMPETVFQDASTASSKSMLSTVFSHHSDNLSPSLTRELDILNDDESKSPLTKFLH